MKFKELLKESYGVGESLARWNTLSLHDKIQSIYVQSTDSGWKFYFHPQSLQKNGGIAGIGFSSDKGKITGKAKHMSVPKMNFDWYKKVDERDENQVPKKVMDKIINV